MQNGPAELPPVAALLCGFLFGAIIGTLIGAIILRAAVALYNKLVGGDDSSSAVPAPSMGLAMGIKFVTMCLNMLAGFFIGLVMAGAANDGMDPGLPAQLISLPVSLVITTGITCVMLPTSIGRAIVVTLFEILIALAVAIFFGAILFAIMLGTAN